MLYKISCLVTGTLFLAAIWAVARERWAVAAIATVLVIAAGAAANYVDNNKKEGEKK